MAVDVKIIVTDAPPLITLAAAQSLDYLLYPALPIIVPDAVYYEATGSAGKLGAQQIVLASDTKKVDESQRHAP